VSIFVVTGPPGAGKTYYTVRCIAQGVIAGKFVATNVRLVDDWAERIASTTTLRFMPRRRRARCDEWRRRVIYVEDLDDLARVRLSTEGHEKCLEGRGLAVFDEAGEALDARDWNADKERRRSQNRFARQHRKLGWDVHFVCQEAEQIDTRVRGMAEFEIRLRNLKKFRLLGVRVFPFNCFVAIWHWHAGRSADISKREWFLLNRKLAGLYNTFQLVQDVSVEALELPAPARPCGTMLTADELLALRTIAELSAAAEEAAASTDELHDELHAVPDDPSEVAA
jgi:hypothetical protein